jgi:hypothetical protein
MSAPSVPGAKQREGERPLTTTTSFASAREGGGRRRYVFERAL